MDTSKLDSIISRMAIWIVVAAILVAAITAFMYFSMFEGDLSAEQEHWGQFGDFFGGTLNPIFGLLSLIAILVTLFIQTRELSHSTRALKEQSQHVETQAFENTLFAIVNLNNENVREIRLKGPGDFNGRRALRKLVDTLKGIYDREKKRETEYSNETLLLSATYKRFFNDNRQHVGQYFRTLSEIFKFIEERLPAESATDYFQIVRSQMSDEELTLLLYHAIVNPSDFDLGLLVQKGLFKGIAGENLLNSTEHKAYIGEG